MTTALSEGEYTGAITDQKGSTASLVIWKDGHVVRNNLFRTRTKAESSWRKFINRERRKQNAAS